MKYFDHDVTSYKDEAMFHMRRRHGGAAVDAYWTIIEVIYREQGPLQLRRAGFDADAMQAQCTRNADAMQAQSGRNAQVFDDASQRIIDELSFFLQIAPDTFADYVLSMLEFGLLIENEDGFITSERAQNNIEGYEENRVKKKAAADARWSKTKGKGTKSAPVEDGAHAQGMQEQCTRNAHASAQGDAVQCECNAKEKEKEKEKENKEKEKKKKKNDDFAKFIQGALDSFNEITGSSMFAMSSEAHLGLRKIMDSGRTLDDVRLVIADKNRQWGKDPNHRRWLRPETLFGEKFESHLQSAQALKSEVVDLHAYA